MREDKLQPHMYRMYRHHTRFRLALVDSNQRVEVSMDLPQVFNEIESLEFRAEFATASRLTTLLTFADKKPCVQALRDSAQTPDGLKRLQAHIEELCQRSTKPESGYLLDVAFTVYLNVLHDRDTEAARRAAVLVGSLPNVSWAETISQAILSQPRVQVGG
jgi:hypothetical protein